MMEAIGTKDAAYVCIKLTYTFDLGLNLVLRFLNYSPRKKHVSGQPT